MDLTPTDEQEALVSATAEWCRDNLALDQARHRPADLWTHLEAMGWVGMTDPAIGLDHATEALVFAELGRFLAPVALLSSAVAARGVGVGGPVALAIVEGGKLRVFDPVGKAVAAGTVGDRLVTVPLPGAIVATAGLDLTAPVAIVDPLPQFEPVADPRAALHLRLLAAAFAVGCAEAAGEMAAQYAKLREQFDRPIGWFQALKHMCSDMAVRSAVARSQLCYAACALDDGGADAAFHVAAAKRLADQAALENARANIQVHGGIGMTDEALPHLMLKRAHLLGFVAPADPAVLLGEIA